MVILFMKNEILEKHSNKILGQLKAKYPNSESFDMDGDGNHFVCEVEPTKEHPEYDRAVEVIFKSKPHKHLKMKQQYKIISGKLKLYIDDEIVDLVDGDEYIILPGKVHWAESDDGCWLEIYSQPGWTKEDHIPINL